MMRPIILNWNVLSSKCPIKQFIRLKYKLKKDRLDLSENSTSKASPDVLNFLESSPHYVELKNLMPKSLLRKYKTSESMYLFDNGTAKYILDVIADKLGKNTPIVEVNPGLGVLTREIIKRKKCNAIYLYETSSQFHQLFNEFQEKHPGRMEYKTADFFGMWKLAFQDKLDQGTRMQDLLGNLATDDFNRDVKIVGAMPSSTFIQHLIYTILFHNSTNLLGRPDLFITMPIHIYEFLSDSKVQNRKNKSIPSLFQILFDYQILAKVRRNHYLPWLHNAQSSELQEEEHMYLVNITQKEKLPCSADNLPLLWYFFRPHMLSKTTRVIPSLEQWIPGCGVWLISGQDPPDTNKSLAPGDDDAKLPHMTIFTQFGDLNLQQKLNVFKRFISWPEFEHCPFRVTMENNLPKSISGIDTDGKEQVGTHMEDAEAAMSDTEEDKP